MRTEFEWSPSEWLIIGDNNDDNGRQKQMRSPIAACLPRSKHCGVQDTNHTYEPSMMMDHGKCSEESTLNQSMNGREEHSAEIACVAVAVC